MTPDPINTDEMRVIALEEGLRAGLELDNLRLAMLKEAVDWLCDLTDLPIIEVRRQLANRKGGQVAAQIATINAVRALLKEPNAKNKQ